MKKFLLFLIIGIGLSVTTHAALIPDMKFRRLDTRDGLSNSQINSILKDSRGFVWIGTPYGLNRYDGYRFKTFYANMRDTTTMRDNYVNDIYEAYDGRLWMKQGMNYCIYDPETESFIRDINPEVAKMGIKGTVDFLYIDSHKNFWVKTYDQGYYYYNPKTRHSHHFALGYGPQEINPTYGISSMTDLGSSVIASTNNGELFCMDGEKGWISWQNKWLRRHGSPESQDYLVRADRKGNLFVRVLDKTFVYRQKEHKWYTSLTELMHAYGVPNVPEHTLSVWDILVDRKGWIWAATDHDGLFVIDLQNKQLRQFQHNKYDQTTLSDNTVTHLYMDNDGHVWIGSYKNGINEYIESKESLRSLELGDITTAREDRWGNYWIGTNDNGILVYDPRTGETLQHYTTANSPLMGNIMVASCEAHDGSFWFGTYNGGLVHCIPTATGAARGEATIVNYRATGEARQLASNNVWSVTEDRWHRIWLGTLGGGLQMLDPKTGRFSTWNTQNSTIPSDYLATVSWTQKGWLLVGTSWYYSIFNPVKLRLINYDIPGAQDLSPNTASTVCVMEDSRGLIWQGSASGAIVYDAKTHATHLLDMTKGLYGSSVCSITEDQQHTMWVVTDHGVSRVVPQQLADGTWQFIVQSFNSADGLQEATFNQRSASITRKGLLLIGGQGGLDIINPRLISGNSHSSEHPVLSGLLLFEQPVAVGEKIDGHVILDRALSMSNKLNLRGYENSFTLQLGSNAGNVRNSRRFAYKIDGSREGWVKTSEQNPNINFTSMHHGDYMLHVRMLNADGTLGANETTLSIHISAPLWRTRWALLLYTLCLLGAGWWWRKRFLKRQQEHLLLEQRRRETEKQQWMSEMRQQLQAEGLNTASTAQPTQDSQSFTPIVTDLVGFVNQLVETYQAPDNKKATISFQSAEQQLNMSFDTEQLGKAIRTLLNNSVHFTTSDCQIEVFTGKVDGQAVIRISDNGLGIPEEAREHMFDANVGQATGTDLFSVKRIAERHGGTVSATDRPQGGTVFSLQLPLSQQTDDIVVEDAIIIDENGE